MSASFILIIVFGLIYIIGLSCIIASMILDKEPVTITILSKPRHYYSSLNDASDLNLDNLVDDDDASVIINE